MANALIAPSSDSERRSIIRHALREVLPRIPEVEAVYVSLDGSYVTVRAAVREVDFDLADRLVEAAFRLDQLVPGMSFDIFARTHQGRGPRSAFGDIEPDYDRAAA